MKRHGYTLIELLVVVSVAGVLATLLLPALAQNAQNADSARQQEIQQRAQCMSKLKRIALGLMQYTYDYDEKYPPAAAKSTVGQYGRARSAANINNPQGRMLYGWVELVDPYVTTDEIFQCPSEKHAAGSDPRQTGYTDYWLNRNVASRYLAAMETPVWTLLAGDGDGGSAASNARYAINSLPRAWIDTYGSPSRRHLDRACYAFADGHAKVVSPQGITTAKHSPTVTATFSIK